MGTPRQPSPNGSSVGSRGSAFAPGIGEGRALSIADAGFVATLQPRPEDLVRDLGRYAERVGDPHIPWPGSGRVSSGIALAISPSIVDRSCGSNTNAAYMFGSLDSPAVAAADAAATAAADAAAAARSSTSGADSVER